MSAGRWTGRVKTALEGQFNDEKSYYGQQAAGYGVKEKVVAGYYDGE